MATSSTIRPMDIQGEQCHAGFQGSNVQLLSICPPHQARTELVCPRLRLNHAGAEASNVKSSAKDVMSESAMGQSDTKGMKEIRGDDR